MNNRFKYRTQKNSEDSDSARHSESSTSSSSTPSPSSSPLIQVSNAIISSVSPIYPNASNPKQSTTTNVVLVKPSVIDRVIQSFNFNFVREKMAINVCRNVEKKIIFIFQSVRILFCLFSI